MKRYQSDEERSILTGMIVNDRVLSRIHTHLKSEKKPFRAKWCNMVCGWCLTYFSKYGKAPRQIIQTLFRDFAGKSEDEEVVSMMEKFLASLSDDYKALSKELNEDHLLDTAARFFNQVRMERLCQSVEADLVNRDVEEAHKKVASFNPVTLATSAMVDVFTDQEAWNDAVTEEENEVLVLYPGALGEFFGNHLARDGFIAMLAPEKRGKSFWLIDVAWRASVLGKRKTLLYSVGDMSQRQMMRRLIVRAARRPLSATDVKRPMQVRKGRDSSYEVDTETLSHKERITKVELREAREKVQRKSASQQSLLKLRCTSNSTTRVADIRSDIDELVKGGWVPDVVVIDYADILAPEVSSSGEDFRHQINETWKALRRLSQDYHILVVTATQSDAASYETKTLRRSNFSEDKRKLAHPTGMFGINQTEEEKKKEIYRLNWIALREGFYSESYCVTCAGSLALSNPAMVSCW